jgi:hypothetical protein
MLCKFIIKQNELYNLINRFAKYRQQNPWVDSIREMLCGKLLEHLHLVTIFNFDSKQYHGHLEESILEAVFNGLLLRGISK